jgi:hypothetical protein
VQIRMFAVVVVLAGVAAPSEAQMDPDYWRVVSRDSHIRASDPAVSVALREGLWKSETFRRLVERVMRSDVIVYIELDGFLRAGLDGQLAFMSSAGTARYVRISVRPQNKADRFIAMIGHELHHAVEVADDPTVVDPVSLAALFQRIGGPRGVSDRYETKAAMAVGRRIWLEVGARRAPDGTLADRDAQPR